MNALNRIWLRYSAAIHLRQFHSYPIHQQFINKSLQCCSSYSTTNPTTVEDNQQKFIIEKLTSRSLIRLKGENVKEFLQSLITNDMAHLDNEQGVSKSLFTMFLNKSGRILYDAIIYKPQNTTNIYLIECDKLIDTELQKHLKIFRVRKKIDIDVIGRDQSVWVTFKPDSYQFQHMTPEIHSKLAAATLSFNKSDIPTNIENDLILVNDPRVKYLGSRILAPSNIDLSKHLLNCELAATGSEPTTTTTTNEYQQFRYKLGIAEGIEELPIGKSFPLESNCDFLHGVSFHKGCYLGQEFTARTHHTGVIRKRLMPFKFLNKNRLTHKSGNQIETDTGTVVGKLRGFNNDWGLALIKFETVLKETAPIVVDRVDSNVTGITERPVWWPHEAPKQLT